MATLTLLLETRKANKDGKYPLVFRIGANKKYAFISSGVHLLPSQFNTQKSSIVGNAELNAKIKLQEAEYLQKLHLLLLDNPYLNDPQEIKKKMLQKPVDDITITEFWEEHIESLYTSGRNGGAKVYKMSLSALSKHIDFNIPFKSFTYRELIQLENRLFKHGVSINGIGVYFRSLRAICNKAINTDIVAAEFYPFRKYKIKKDKTTPRVLSMSEMKAYFQLDLPPSHPDYTYWNLGKLIFMLRGINITDLLQLNSQSLKNNRIIYKRSKTGKLYSIAMTKEIEQVLSTFQSSTTLLGKVDLAQIRSRRKTEHLIQKRKVINGHLKKIGVSLGFKEELTTYVFRYSYANIAKQLGYSKDLIAEALGHEYGNSVTGIYLEQFDLELIDTMNDNIIQTVLQI
jgi:integrase